MQANKIKVQFVGALGDRFGPGHSFRAQNMQELGSAFRVCIPGFTEYVLEKQQQGILYQALNVKTSGYELPITPEDMDRPFGDCSSIILSPVVAGSGGQAFKLLGGALLLGVGIATGGTSLLALGGSFLLQGISKLISPASRTPKDKSDREQSYLFSGLRDTADQDLPVPLIYGRNFIPLKIQLSTETSTADSR